MLKVTNKDYEIEETIQLSKEINGREETIYEFKMQLSEKDLSELKHILFDFTDANLKKYMSASLEEKQKLEEKAGEEIQKNEDRFLDICFKEHKDEFRKKAGEYKFAEMVDLIRGFLLNFFMEKQISPLNTSITNLTKITNNLQKFK